MPVGIFFFSAEEVGQTASRSNPSCAYQDSFSGNVGQQWRRHQSPVCGNCSHEGTKGETSLPFHFYAAGDLEYSTSFPESLLFPSSEAGNKANPENEVDKYPFSLI